MYPTSINDDMAPLLPYIEQLRECVILAHQEQSASLRPETRAKTRKRVVSGLMNDLVTFNMRETLQGQPGIKIIEKYDQTKVLFDSKYLMKAKKRDHRNRISYVPTSMALDFVYQLEQLKLPDMPSPATNVMLNYWWNKTRTDIERISIVWPNGNNSYSREYEIPLTKGTALTQVPPTVMLELALPPKPVLPRQKALNRKANVKKTPKQLTRSRKRNEQQRKASQPRNGHEGQGV